MRRTVYYLSGGKREMPGRVNVSVRRKDFNVELMQHIPYADIVEVSLQYEVKDKQLSAGKAVAGAVLFGGVGMVAGAAMGGKKVESVLKIKYRIGAEQKELLLLTKQAAIIKRAILARMEQASRPKAARKKRQWTGIRKLFRAYINMYVVLFKRMRKNS